MNTTENTNQFLLMINGREVGPFSPEDVQAMILKGEIHGDSLLKIAGTQQWVEVSQAFPSAPKPQHQNMQTQQQAAQIQQPQFSFADLEFPEVKAEKETPIEFIKNCWDCYLWCIKNGFSKAGRLRRRHFWRFVLVHSLIYAALSALPWGLRFIYALFMIAPYACAAARRAHDHNKTGWVWLIPFYPLSFIFSEGYRGPNNYGPDPKSK
jgi:uncharacterized membrane protein YhaH (DUF805 family)